MDRPRDRADRCLAVVEIACVVFVVLGLALPFAYGTALFAPYRSLLAAIGRPTEGPTATLLVGILGGSIAGKWALHAAIVRFALRRRLRWARDATAMGLALSVAVSSIACALSGALFHAASIELVPALVVGTPLALAWRELGLAPQTVAIDRMRAPTRTLDLVAISGVAIGLGCAFGTSSPLFAPWIDGIADAHFDGRMPATARAFVVLFCGPIGAAIAAHYALLGMVARHAIARAEVWAAPACALAFLVWFVPDSSISIWSGAAFNAWLVNVPSLAVALLPLGWAGARALSARSV